MPMYSLLIGKFPENNYGGTHHASSAISCNPNLSTNTLFSTTLLCISIEIAELAHCVILDMRHVGMLQQCGLHSWGVDMRHVHNYY